MFRNIAGYAIVGFGVKLARFSKQCCSYRQQKSRDFQARQRDVEDAVPYRLFFRFAANVLCFSPADEGILPYRVFSRAFYYLPPISNT